MKDRAYIRSLIDYYIWSNALFFEAARNLPAEELTREHPGPLKSVFSSLNHLLVVDTIWMAHMRGERHGLTHLQQPLHDDLDSLWAARRKMDQALIDYVDRLSEEQLDEAIEFELLGGNRGRLSRAMVLTHLVTHGNYHRGWIAGMLAHAWAGPPPQDIPVWERATREQRRDSPL